MSNGPVGFGDHLVTKSNMRRDNTGRNSDETKMLVRPGKRELIAIGHRDGVPGNLANNIVDSMSTFATKGNDAGRLAGPEIDSEVELATRVGEEVHGSRGLVENYNGVRTEDTGGVVVNVVDGRKVNGATIKTRHGEAGLTRVNDSMNTSLEELAVEDA